MKKKKRKGERNLYHYNKMISIDSRKNVTKTDTLTETHK